MAMCIMLTRRRINTYYVQSSSLCGRSNAKLCGEERHAGEVYNLYPAEIADRSQSAKILAAKILIPGPRHLHASGSALKNTEKYQLVFVHLCSAGPSPPGTMINHFLLVAELVSLLFLSFLIP